MCMMHTNSHTRTRRKQTSHSIETDDETMTAMSFHDCSLLKRRRRNDYTDMIPRDKQH